jgi:RNA polymerase sigma-70 factor (ECF subfamily)
MELGPAGTVDDPLTALPDARWLEPIPDVDAIPGDADPAERAALRQSIRLAFVAALQHLPPRQRAALLLAEVLGLSAAEVAETLETTVPAVNSALQRARATLAERDLAGALDQPSDAEARLAERFAAAFERYDMDALTTLLRDDATMCMPPYALWLRGPAPIRAWMLGRGGGCRGSRLVPAPRASGAPAFGQYKPPAAPGAGYTPWALVVVEVAGDRIGALSYFLDTERLFPRFGLPPRLDA